MSAVLDTSELPQVEDALAIDMNNILVHTIDGTDDGEPSTTVIYQGNRAIGLIKGMIKFVVQFDIDTKKLMSYVQNEYIKELMLNGVVVTQEQMDVYIDYYLKE